MRTTVAAAVATVTCLAIAPPASALKIKYVQEVQVAGPDAITTVESFCRNGFSVTGGGAFSNGAYSQTKIQDTHPIDGPDSDSKPDDGWRASIWNTASTFGNIESQAICVKNLATKVKSDPFTPGFTAPNVACPKGMTVTGGGIETAGTFALPPSVLSSRPETPSAGGRAATWFVNADPPGMANIQAFGYAICIEKRELDLAYNTFGFTADNQDQDTGAVECGDGERLLGPGAAGNSTNTALVTIFGLDTTDDANTKLDDGTSVTVDNYNVSSDAFPEAYAVCVK
jgi:hypothetical protein